MKLHNFKAIIFGAACIAAFASCSDNDDNNLALPEKLELLSATPATGMKVQPGLVEVVLEFNAPVMISDTAKLTADGGDVHNPYTVSRYLKAQVPVAAGASCRFTVAPGAITMFSRTATNTETYSVDIQALAVASNRSVEAQRLLEFMRENTGVKMLSGVSACVNWNQNEALWVYKHTGRYPAINNFDFIHDVYSSPGGWIDYSNPAPAITWAEENGVVGAMWHWGQLANNGYDITCTPGSAPDQTSFSPADIFDPESEGYQKMISDIDRVANFMKPLANQRIPILWRPLHEAQGNWNETLKDEWRKSWFWWGIDGPEACAELWRVMYDRMVNYHGLTNLIWVYNSGDSMQWYPGDEYVDIVGYDFYNSSMADMEYWYTFMKEHFPGKLLAICECGNIPKLSEQWEKGLYWNYFMPWWDNAITSDPAAAEFNNTNHGNADVDYWNDAWSCDFMLSRDQMPSFRD